MIGHTEPRQLKTVLAACAAALLLSIPGGAAAADGPAPLLADGSEAPLFETVSIDGAPYSFAEDLAKGPVFLVFWSIF